MKLLPITTCRSCWHFDEDYGCCDLSDYKKVEYPSDIPDWCPLEDMEVKDGQG